MGTWGTGLFADDTACEVRDEYVNLLKSGLSPKQAEKEILDRFADLLEDKQVECLVILPLADTQWKYGRLSTALKKRAINLLINGGDLEFWEADAPKDVSARKRVLEKLRAKLNTDPPPPKPIKVVIRKAKPKKIRLTAPIGTVFLFPVTTQVYLPLVLLAYYELEKSVEPVFCVYPIPMDKDATIREHAFNKPPLELPSGLGPKTVFGAFPDDERTNPYKQLQEIGIVLDIQLPNVPEYPTFYFFGGLPALIREAFYAQANS